MWLIRNIEYSISLDEAPMAINNRISVAAKIKETENFENNCCEKIKYNVEDQDDRKYC